jgi:hypothetical protein
MANSIQIAIADCNRNRLNQLTKATWMMHVTQVYLVLRNREIRSPLKLSFTYPSYNAWYQNQKNVRMVLSQITIQALM